jgi:cytochrome b6-f complex iron-sulfur subunit
MRSAEMGISSRRKFLATCLGAIGVTGFGAVLYPLLSYLSPSKDAGERQKVTFQLSELAEGGAHYFQMDGKAGVVVRPKGGSIAVFSAVCTHLGCIVQWQKNQDRFLCPCHGGQFSAQGAVLGGPPPKPLEKLPFVVNGTTITIG